MVEFTITESKNKYVFPSENVGSYARIYKLCFLKHLLLHFFSTGSKENSGFMHEQCPAPVSLSNTHSASLPQSLNSQSGTSSQKGPEDPFKHWQN